MAISNLELLCRQNAQRVANLSHTLLRRSGESREQTTREEAVRTIGERIALELGIEESWLRVAPLGRPVDKLIEWEHLHEGPISLVERYETITPTGEKGQHIRVYGHPQKDHVPMLLIADEKAAESLEAREPMKTFRSLRRLDSYHPLHQHVLQKGHVTSHDKSVWTDKKVTFQLVGVLEGVRIEGLPAMRLQVYKDMVHGSGYTILVWPNEGPLTKDMQGKPLWGIVMTNSPHHRPDGNWQQIRQ